MAKKRAWDMTNPLYRWLHKKSNSSHSTTRGVTHMRRRRKGGFRRFAKSSARPLGVLIGGGAYGAIRAKLSSALDPITSKIPLGGISDEVGLFVLHYFINKNVKNKLVKDVTFAGMAVEAARIGEAVISGSVLSSSTSGVSSNNTFQTLG